MDYIWRSLLLAGMTSLIVSVIASLMYLVLRKYASQLQIKWFFNHQSLLFISIFIGSFIWIAFGDPELATRCFDQFVKESSSYTLTRNLAGFWLLCVSAFASFEIYRFYQAMRLARSFQTLQSSRISQILQSLQKRLKINAKVEICTISNNVSPFVFGIFRFKLVIPETMLDLSSSDLENILAHEMIHIRDRDSLWMLFNLVLRRVMFFNPLIFWLSSVYVQTIEKAADEEALSKAHLNPARMMQSLILVASLVRDRRAQPFALNASQSFQEIKGRIESLSVAQKSVFSKKKFGCLISVSILTSLLMSLAQAQVMVERKDMAGMMCTQIHHEKMIEAWLNIEPAPNKCTDPQGE